MTYELRFERLINAKPAVVFDMFTEPGGQAAFYQQNEPGWIVRSDCDLRVGGVWSVEFGPSENELYRHRHVFMVIDRPRRLLMTTTETRLDGSSFDTEMEFLFEDRDGRTLMTLLHRGFPTAELRDEHRVGLPEAFSQLERFVAAAPTHTSARGTGMRPLVLQMGLTLDGFVHGAAGYEDWGLPPEEDDVVAWKTASLREAGTHIMGRVTYEVMAAVWPQETGVYADVMNDVPKVVFSSTLTRADWPETRIASGDLAENIDRLKREPGGLILAHGGATFVDALIRARLIDEYRLVIHPVVIGHGRGLFSALHEPLRLNLIETQTFPSGTGIQVWRPR